MRDCVDSRGALAGKVGNNIYSLWFARNDSSFLPLQENVAVATPDNPSPNPVYQYSAGDIKMLNTDMCLRKNITVGTDGM